MKRVILFLSLFALITGLQAQSMKDRPVYPAAKKNLAVKQGESSSSIPGHFLQQRHNPMVKSGLSVVESTIGITRYDLQTNQSCQNHLYRFPDGTISAAWTYGMAETSFTDRGTGYNYFDGTTWGSVPTVRIETKRTGWPSVFALGNSGEGVISHDFSTPGALVLSTRATKGSGLWTESQVPHSVGPVSLSWPRAVSNGTDHNNIHLIALSRPVVSGGNLYQGMDGALLYSRSLDGGNTWDIANLLPPGMSNAEYNGFGGDSYSWAEPVGNTLAFVVGENWTDLFLMKSTDNGSSWTKKMIFQHPYPFFDETHTLVLDTPSVSDGSLAVVLDANGKAHVFSGIMRVLNDDTTDAVTSYFPYSDGLFYWHEDMPAFQSLDFDTLWNNDHLVGYLQDMNNNDTVMEFDGIGTYYLSLTSMPTAAIDEDGNIFVAFTSVMENLSNGLQNYRHVWARISNDGGLSWFPFKDLTGHISHNFHECVFPSLAPSINSHLHLVYQFDDEPGLAVRGDEDPYTDNTISYLTLPKTDFGLSLPEVDSPRNSLGQVYPNPCNDLIYIELNMTTPARVTASVHNLLGQELYSVDKGMMGTGNHQLDLGVSSLQAGLYFCTLKLGTYSYTKTIIKN